MINPVELLKVKAAEAGTNLTEVCRNAGVDRSMIERWKKNVPKALITYELLNEEINKILKNK